MEQRRILSATAVQNDSPLDESRPLGYAVAFLYSLVIALFWIPAFLVRRLSCVLSEIGVDSWPRANGSVTGSNVKVVHGWVVDYAIGRLDYSYRVAGQYYAGSITRQYPDEQAAWDFLDARRDKVVVVRYKDDRAQSSTLRDLDQDLAWNVAGKPGLLSMVWNHWRDELRGEKPTAPNDEGLDRDGEDRSDSFDDKNPGRPRASR
jgi:hypothetical protein